MQISCYKQCNAIFFLALYLLISSCATIVGKPFQSIAIQSSPENANVTIIDESGITVFSGETPTGVILDKHDGSYFGGKHYKVTIDKFGYKARTIGISAHPNGWYIIGNIFFGGLIGWLIVDPLHGGMYTLSPENINCYLGDKKEQASNKNSINICLLEDVPTHLRDKLQPISQNSIK